MVPLVWGAVSYERGTPVETVVCCVEQLFRATRFEQHSQPRLREADAIPSGRVFVINTRIQRKLLHTRTIVVIVKHHLVQIDRRYGPTEHLSQPLAAMRLGLFNCGR